MKICTKCKIDRPLDDFHNDKTGKNGKRSHCRFCISDANKAWQARDPERARAAWRKSYNKYYDKHTNRLRAYKLSQEDYDKLKAFNNNCCHICNKEFTPQEHIDHCHDTKKVRGLLCLKCNTGLGNFNDSIDLMKKAIDYIEKQGFINLEV